MGLFDGLLNFGKRLVDNGESLVGVAPTFNLNQPAQGGTSQPAPSQPLQVKPPQNPGFNFQIQPFQQNQPNQPSQPLQVNIAHPAPLNGISQQGGITGAQDSVKNVGHVPSPVNQQPGSSFSNPSGVHIGNVQIPQSPVGNPVPPPPTIPQNGGPQQGNSDPVGQFLKPFGDAVTGLGHSVGTLATTPYNAAKLIGDQLINPNSQATKNANTQMQHDADTFNQFLQFGPRAVTQGVQSLAAPIESGISHALNLPTNLHPTENTFTPPNNPVSNILFGKQPIPSVENVYKTTQQQNGTPSAVGTAAVTGLTDALAAKGGVDTISKGIHALGNANRTGLMQAAVANSPVVNVPIESLKSYEGAPDRSKVDQYKQQISSGQNTDPLIALKDSQGNLGVEDGKHRLQAYQELGYTHVPVQITTPEDLQNIIQGGYAKIPGSSNAEPENTPTSSSSENAAHTPISPDGSLPNTTPSKGFIIKEGPIQNGKQDVIRIKADPTTGKLIQSQESITAPKVQVDEYAKTFNISKDQAKQDLATLQHQPPTKNIPDNEPIKLTREERQNIINNNENQTPIKQIDLKTTSENIKGAIAEAVGTSADERARYEQVDRLQHKLSPEDRNLLYRYDNGEDLQTLAREAKNPDRFLKAATAARDALDHSLGVDRTAGGVTLRQKNYIPHSYKATPQMMDELGIEPDQRFHIGPYTGFHDTAAKYPSYLEASRQTGGLLKPLHENPFDAILEYGQGAAHAHEGDLLKQALLRAVPNDIGELGDTSIGGARLHSAPNDLPFSATDRVMHELNGFREQAHINNLAVRLTGKAYDAANGFQKKLLFSLAWFHQVNISLKYAAATLGSGHARLMGRGISEAILSGIHPKIAEALDRKYIADGTADWQRENGVIHGVQQARYRMSTDDGLRSKIAIANERFNPLDMMHRSMGNFINAYSNVLSQFAKDHVPSGTPEATALAQEYNALLGHIDAKISNLSPFVAQTVRRGGLAPQFLLSQGKIIKDATLGTKGAKVYKTGIGLTNANDVARTAVIGNRLVNTAIGAAITYIASGQMPTFQNLLNRGGITGGLTGPNFDVNEKNQKGEHQVEYLPTDYAGLFESLIKDPQHFGAARYAPALSAIERFATNKDWNGNPLSNPNDPNPTKERLLGAAKGLLPIGVQNVTNSNLSTQQKIEQEFGTRAHVNPGDPQYQNQQKYYNQQNQYAKDIASGNFSAVNPALSNVDPKMAAYWAAQLKSYQDLNPGKDINGVDNARAWNALSNEQKASYLLMNDQKTGAQSLSPIYYIQQQNAQLDPSRPHSPLYDLKGNDGVAFTLDGSGQVVGSQNVPRAQVALAYAAQPATSDQKPLILAANPWLSDYEKANGQFAANYKPNMTQYLQDQGWTQPAIDKYWQQHPSTPPPISNAITSDQQKLLDSYYSITDPTERAQYFQDNAKELGVAFSADATYKNQKATAEGVLPDQLHPVPNANAALGLSQLQKNPNHDKAIGKANALLIKNNPDLNQYLADSGLYTTAKDLARYQYQDPAHPGLNASQLINLDRPIDQATLKGISSLGNYDIGKNAQGQYSFMGKGGPGSLGQGFTSAGKSGQGYAKSAKRMHSKMKRAARPAHAYKLYSKKVRMIPLKTPSTGSKRELAITPKKIKPIKLNF